MSEQNNKLVVPVWQTAVNLVIIIAAFLLCLIALAQTEGTTLLTLSLLCTILTVLSGAYYCFSGYKKNGSLFFKMFVYVDALSFVFVLLYLMDYKVSMFNGLVNILTFGFLCILAAGTNLGMKRSFSLAGSIFVLQIINLILVIIGGVNPGATIFYPIAKVLVAALLLFIVYAKYRDKIQRNRKV